MLHLIQIATPQREPSRVSWPMRQLYETAVLSAAACLGLGATFVVNPLLPF